MPSLFRRWSQTSPVPARTSCQPMYTPPAPSASKLAADESLSVEESVRPAAGHAGSSVPFASTCCALSRRGETPRSVHATNAPPAPSLAMAGCNWSAGALFTSRPFAGQPEPRVPEGVKRST
ncbi:MAG: hypothetical protein IPJ04_06280 [Candidatus Eisenbacteria bacterium]|nr:hypothetical protein [Candidatus Eisenbacteria bacterium]